MIRAYVSSAAAAHRGFARPHYDVLVGPTLRSEARKVVGRFRPEEIYSTQQGDLRLPTS